MSQYSLEAYGDMITDKVRFEAYVRAMRQTILPGDIVLDIGTGTGIFALLAAQMGARHVFAVESSDAVEVGRACAAANGLHSSITFHQGHSKHFNPPERADVMISDLRGVLPLHGTHIASIIDARERLLKPGGSLIPRQDTVRIAIASSPASYKRIAAPWTDRVPSLDLAPALRLATNRWRSADIGADELVSKPLDLFTLHYGSMSGASVKGGGTLVLERTSTCHGLAMWFDAVLADSVTYSTAPGAPRLAYGHAFFPWPRQIALQAGDLASVEIRADSVGADYEWRWLTQITDARGVEKAVFDQSTVQGMILSPNLLRRRASSAMPVLDAEGRVLSSALAMFDGERDLASAAALLLDLYPERFATGQEALDFVADASARFGLLV